VTAGGRGRLSDGVGKTGSGRNYLLFCPACPQSMAHTSVPTGLTGPACPVGRVDQIARWLASFAPTHALREILMSTSLSRPRCRRQIDPTTCERDYDSAEIEFMQAVERYKRTSGRRFPTCSEMLAIVRSLGYVRVLPAGDLDVEPALSAGPPSA